MVASDETYGKITLGPLNRIYADSQMPYTMDGSWATLKNADGSMTFFETAMGRFPYYYRHTGTFDNPLKTQFDPFVWDYNGYNHEHPSGCWIPNIYKHTKDTLIGLVHREDLYPANNDPYGRGRFFIGLARSFDGGTHWKYLGDVLGTIGNALKTPGLSNIGGVPYLIVDNYIYLYFNEKNLNGDPDGLSVARASVTDVINSIKNDRVCPFLKYNNGNWTENGMVGKGSNIISDIQPQYDFHSDAAYCSALGKYLITVQTHSLYTLLLYQSTDGINWGERIKLDYAPGNMQPYSSFVGFDSDASDDSHIVGSEFYIYIDRKNISNYDYDEMYYRKVTIKK
ncbi:hypothetical protein JZU61_07255 [bacterium]|nr:hypothetical protein [bacterium]